MSSEEAGSGTPAIRDDAPGDASAGLEFGYLARRLRELSGFDLSRYKGEQMERRTRQWMARNDVRSVAMLVRLLERDEKARLDLINYLIINTSQFFRDPQVFTALEQRVLPQLVAAYPRLQVWSAGCSIGAEPYSLAILLDRMGQGGRHWLLATDIDGEALAQARAGRYHDLHLVNVPDEVRRRYFEPAGPGVWQLGEGIRRMVHFRQHDLLKDPVLPGFHLILFRHVMIYLTAEAQDLMLKRLSRALTQGGYLVVGGPEHIARPDAYGLVRVEHCIYRRTGEGEGRGRADA